MRRTKQIYLPALAAVLLLGCVILMAGTTFARYQMSGDPENLTYKAKKNARVYLWSDYRNESENTWSVVDSSTGSLRMDFYVTNGESEYSYSAEDQNITVRLVASLGIRDKNDLAQVALVVDGKEDAPYYAVAQQIEYGTPLYAEFGDGYLYTIRDADGKEVAWPLQGGQISLIPMEFYVRGVPENQSSLLQVQVFGDVTD